MKNYSIEVNREQAKVISLALDFFSRMESGQFEAVFRMIPWKYEENLRVIQPLLNEIQQTLTGMTGGNLGISNVSNTARVAYDLHQVIRNYLAWEENPSGGITTDFDSPLQFGNEPLAKMQLQCSGDKDEL